jgi:2C-methyl-D-erythritol 2,4-cyclodiphosphate synthase
MKLFAALGLVLASSAVVASEVGTKYPNGVEQPQNMVLALAEKGAGSSWTIEPVAFEATAHQTAKLNDSIEKMNQDIAKQLQADITKQFAESLQR